MPDGRFVLLAFVIAIALTFDYTNGFHDTANAIATSVSTRALSPRIAVLLSAIGIYGVISYSVAQRTHEMGLRAALGASGGRILGLVITGGMGQVGLGLAIGLAGAFALTRTMKSLLFGISATDPLTIVVVGVMLAAVALLACYIPARRATKVDPMVALRYE